MMLVGWSWKLGDDAWVNKSNAKHKLKHKQQEAGASENTNSR